MHGDYSYGHVQRELDQIAEGEKRLEFEMTWKEEGAWYLRNCVGRGDWIAGMIACDGISKGFLNEEDDWILIGHAVIDYDMVYDDGLKRFREIEFIVDSSPEYLFKKRKRATREFVERVIEVEKEAGEKLSAEGCSGGRAGMFWDMDNLGFKGFSEEEMIKLIRSDRWNKFDYTLGCFGDFLKREHPRLYRVYDGRFNNLFTSVFY